MGINVRDVDFVRVSREAVLDVALSKICYYGLHWFPFYSICPGGLFISFFFTCVYFPDSPIKKLSVSMYRRGAKRWKKKYYLLHGHKFAARRFNKVSFSFVVDQGWLRELRNCHLRSYTTDRSSSTYHRVWSVKALYNSESFRVSGSRFFSTIGLITLVCDGNLLLPLSLLRLIHSLRPRFVQRHFEFQSHGH